MIREIARLLAYVPLLLVLGCADGSGNSKPQATTRPAARGIMLQDVQGLYGGQNVYIRWDGATIVQVAEGGEGSNERRYEFKLQEDELRQLRSLITKHDFVNIRIKERMGVPDEALPTITVRPESGQAATVAKWAGDKDKDFDAVYDYLRGVVSKAKSRTPAYEGRFTYEWRPEGFEKFEQF